MRRRLYLALGLVLLFLGGCFEPAGPTGLTDGCGGIYLGIDRPWWCD